MRYIVLCFAAILLITGGPARADGARNHMAETASPYLHLHATDPVHWRPWNEASITEAERLGLPILLSIGYLSCHWCHVMQRESFAVPATARLINENFLPILIDREEMPDLDTSFQSAAALMGLPGGWPLTMFLTPGGKPFFGGTYFPPVESGGMSSFTHVLNQVIETYRLQRDALTSNADAISRELARRSKSASGDVTMAHIDAAAGSFLGQVNPFTGGFGEAPMFPMTVAQELIWRAYLRTGDLAYRDAVTTTLTSMIRGGIYDHLGGGFFRYTVDPAWNVPHFEKMLDVNASLLRLMTEVWRETRDPALARAIDQTVAFLAAEMRLPGGAFASALDADSIFAGSGEEEEGAFYLWDKQSITAVLGDKSTAFLETYELAPIADAPSGFAHLYLSDETAEKSQAAQRRALFEARAKRPRPRRDDKVLVDWNAMAITALAEAAMAFDRPQWLDMAERSYRFIETSLKDDTGRLHHSWYADKLGTPATLDDLGGLAGAALTLFEATGNTAYLKAAATWTQVAIAGLWDDDQGGFLATQKNAGPQLLQAVPIYDGPNVSGNARMIDTLARLYYLGGEAQTHILAERMRKTFGGEARDASFGIAGYLNAVETLQTALQVVIIGKRGERATDNLIDTVLKSSLPTRIFQVIGADTELPEGHPARYKVMVDGQPTAYVCKGTFCSLPAITVPELSDSLSQLRRGD